LNIGFARCPLLVAPCSCSCSCSWSGGGGKRRKSREELGRVKGEGNAVKLWSCGAVVQLQLSAVQIEIEEMDREDKEKERKLKYNTTNALHYSTLHYTTLHYTVLYTTLHYTTRQRQQGMTRQDKTTPPMHAYYYSTTTLNIPRYPPYILDCWAG